MICRLLSFTIWLISICEVLNAADFNPATGRFPTTSSNTAIIPVSPDNKPNWMKRHEWINGEAKKGGIELIYVGESIVQHFDAQGKDTWDRYYAPRHALNLASAVTAHSTFSGAWIMETSMASIRNLQSS